MALVKKISHQSLQAHATHTEVECTYDVVIDVATGEKMLQIDTYGSKERLIVGKKSQSIRLSAAALADLKEILRINKL